MTNNTDPVRALRELRDTGDVSDWRAMEAALDAAIEALASAPPSATVGVEYDRELIAKMLDELEPVVGLQHIRDSVANQARLLREAAALASAPPSAPVGVEAVGKTFCEQMEMLRDDFARYSDGDPKVPFVVVREALVAALNEWGALSQQPATVSALEVFRIAGGDTECEPDPTPERALEVLRDLRACYDEALSQQPAAPSGEVVAYTDATGPQENMWTLTPAEYAVVRAHGLGQRYRPLVFGDAAPQQPAAVDEAAALDDFTAYFVKNYPGPNTIIGDPKWHAPRIFRAAQRALAAQRQGGEA